MNPIPAIRAVLAFSALILVGASALSGLGAAGWPFEMFSHFRMHYLALSLILAVLLAACAGRRAALLALCAAGLNVPALAPHLGLPAAQTSQPARAAGPVRDVTVVTVNLLGRPDALDSFRRYVSTVRPDVFLMTEIPWAQWADYDAAFPGYAWRLPLELDVGPAVRAASFGPGPGAAADGRQGASIRRPPHNTDLYRFKHALRHVALFSRLPLEDARMLWAKTRATPVVVAELEFGPCAQPLTVVGLHAFAPLTRRDLAHRDRSLRLGAWAAEQARGPSVLLGDMNATPWSPIVRELTGGRLRDSGHGRLVSATWSRGRVPPALARLPFVGLPIDQVLVSEEITVKDRRTGPDLGSDHRPVMARLSVPLQTTACPQP